MRLRLALISVLVPVLVIAAAVAVGRWAGGAAAADPRSPLAAALDTLPAGTQVAGFTSWSQIREVLGVGSSTAADRAALSDDASLRDLSTRSVLGAHAEAMHESYGWSVADAEWEVYGQSGAGAALVLRLDGSVSFDAVRDRLDELGYVRRGRTWTIGSDGAGVEPDLATALSAVTLVPGRRLVVAADRQAYVSQVLAAVHHDKPSLLSVRSAADVAATMVGADSALLQTGSIACSTTALPDDDPDVQAQARTAVERAGRLAAPEFAGRAIDAGTASSQVMRFALGFRSPAVAAEQVQVRTALARGPFIGRSGRVEDSLVLRSSHVRGSAAVLRFRHDPDSTAYMTGDGPLLLAGCPLPATHGP
jgi:hypothetical protein